MKIKFRNWACVLAAFLTLATCGGLSSVNAKADNSEKRYYDDTPVSPRITVVERIDYTRKEEEVYELPNLVPKYYENTLANVCGPVAGGIVVGYYDKYFENLIPNYTAYYPATGKYKRNDSTHIPALMQSLYTLMRTNVDDVGVSEADCLNGLRSYVQGKGESLSYSSIMNSSNTVLNTSAYISSIQAQKPVLLFCNTITLYTLYLSDGFDELAIEYTANSHIAVGYAYYVVRYYNGNTNFRTDTYLEIATGWQIPHYGYLKISSTEWLDAGYSVTIY